MQRCGRLHLAIKSVLLGIKVRETRVCRQLKNVDAVRFELFYILISRNKHFLRTAAAQGLLRELNQRPVIPAMEMHIKEATFTAADESVVMILCQ